MIDLLVGPVSSLLDKFIPDADERNPLHMKSQRCRSDMPMRLIRRSWLLIKRKLHTKAYSFRAGVQHLVGVLSQELQAITSSFPLLILVLLYLE